MKNILFLAAFLFLNFTVTSQSEQQIENLKIFAKTYGYVKYFHPSDEAATLDWDAFAIYGASQMEKCRSEKEVLSTLRTLYGPIAPSAHFEFADTSSQFDMAEITPEDTKKYELAYWQHKGVSTGMVNRGRPYRSVRVNCMTQIETNDPFGNLMTSINGSEFKGKEIKYSAWVRVGEDSKGTGHLWFRVDKPDGGIGFFDNMKNRPIKESQWAKYEIVAQVDTLAKSLVFGCFLEGKGKLYLDDARLAYKKGEDWVDIPIKNGDFESGDWIEKTEGSQWKTKGNGYGFKSAVAVRHEGQKSALIEFKGDTKFEKGESIFDFQPNFGELIEKRIGDTMRCQIPITLYANDQGTFPKANPEKLSNLNQALRNIPSEPSALSVRLGNVINVYNVFQHFYPYFDVVQIDWEKELEKALRQSFMDKTAKDHHITLQKFTAPLKDGHINVWYSGLESFAPPLTWEWIEDKLIITDVFDDALGLKIGDEVTKIGNQSAKTFFKEIRSRISAGTEGWLAYRAHDMSLFGPKGSKLSITAHGEKYELIRSRDFYREKRASLPKKDTYKEINKDVFYLNLDVVPMETIDELMPQIKNYKSIICDMRGYPKGNHGFIQHLLKANDTTEGWMQVPKIVYPDQENLVDYQKLDWKMEAKEPYIGDKQILFITDGRAISYAESFMGYIEGYRLATIIGQPTAGTNGNVNPFSLPGGYRIGWTGMKVVKHDGSQHHAVGVLPNVYVSKTIEGVKQGKDEFLEKAIELTRKGPVDSKFKN